MVAGQPQVALWQRENPAWQVRCWRCGIVLQFGETDP
jgi:hypothetical protein